MKPARILLLIVAIVAGGLAAFLATRGDAPPETVEVAQAPTAMVLVANADIGVGQRLSTDMLQWQTWPDNALRPEYVLMSNTPDAASDLAGTVARFEIFTGEPIRESKLVHAGQGYLSAVLSKGMRGVSLAVTAVSGAGGFVVPNDRVDVVMTQNGEPARTILENVRVLAIGARLGEKGATGASADETDPQSQMFLEGTVATLEVRPNQAEAVIAAAADGELSLSLRSVADFNEKVDQTRRTGGAVKLIRFGVENSVQSTTTFEEANNSSEASSSGPTVFTPPPTPAPATSSTPSTPAPPRPTGPSRPIVPGN